MKYRPNCAGDAALTNVNASASAASAQNGTAAVTGDALQVRNTVFEEATQSLWVHMMLGLSASGCSRCSKAPHRFHPDLAVLPACAHCHAQSIDRHPPACSAYEAYETAVHGESRNLTACATSSGCPCCQYSLWWVHRSIFNPLLHLMTAAQSSNLAIPAIFPVQNTKYSAYARTALSIAT